MADSKVSNLTEVTALALDDEFLIVDKSDTTMGASGTDKRVKLQTLHQDGGFNRRVPPTGITYDNFDRATTPYTANVTLTSGTLRLLSIWLPGGFTVTNISFMIGSTALTRGSSGSHVWYALYSSALALLRQTADDTSGAVGASALHTTNLSSTYTTTYSGLHYLGIMVNYGSGGAPVMPTLAGTTVTTATIADVAPSRGGPTADTGLTTTAPNPAAAPGTAAGVPYCGVA